MCRCIGEYISLELLFYQPHQQLFTHSLFQLNPIKYIFFKHKKTPLTPKTKMSASVLKQDPDTQKVFKKKLFIRTQHVVVGHLFCQPHQQLLFAHSTACCVLF